jgi:chromate transporter
MENINKPVEEKTPSWREFFVCFLMRGFFSVGDPESQTKKMGNQLVQRRHWLSDEQFVRILSFCRLLPGPQPLQLAILVGYVKRRLPGGVLAGLLFLLPGALLMLLLSNLYVTYGRTPTAAAFFLILKPAVLGILTAEVVKLAATTIRNYMLAAIVVASFGVLSYYEANLLLILAVAGSLHLLISHGWRRLQRKTTQLRILVIPVFVLVLSLVHPHWLRMAWLFLKTGLFSFGGFYASLTFLHQGAVEEYRWVSISQLLDGLALSVALPGSFVLFATFVGYLAGGPTGAILGTFLVFLTSAVLVIVGARYMEELRNNEAIQSFVAGACVAVVGALIFIIIEVAPLALVGKTTVGIAISTFLAVALLNVELGLVAAVSIVGGIFYAIGPIGQIGPIQ